jgi:hypothetical protein
VGDFRSNCTPITSEITSKLQILVKSDMEEFEKAIYIVGTNRQRHALNQRLLTAFAQKAGYPILHWRYRFVGKYANLPSLSANAVYERYPQTHGWFTPGARVFISENIHHELPNGMEAILHSIIHPSSESVEEKWLGALPGQMIEVSQPLFVNVLVDKEKLKFSEWEKFDSWNDKYLIVPIPLCKFPDDVAVHNVKNARIQFRRHA